ncbi:hypothetical protein CVT25_006115 [Psilocybe cyanescens]|uniref:Uncharacterized protein n=1 Tax=Psilocybe cyanescens TaxID=93625 RepID=A0A409X728_PSICY|nr:hypothetical protein CVT25_006115 [Psilocybe cyanescens]
MARVNVALKVPLSPSRIRIRARRVVDKGRLRQPDAEHDVRQILRALLKLPIEHVQRSPILMLRMLSLDLSVTSFLRAITVLEWVSPSAAAAAVLGAIKEGECTCTSTSRGAGVGATTSHDSRRARAKDADADDDDDFKAERPAADGGAVISWIEGMSAVALARGVVVIDLGERWGGAWGSCCRQLDAC